jgi:endonuclease III-like uncharacterized protein
VSTGIREVTLVRLQELVHSSGYYRQKAQRLKDFVSFMDEKHAGSLETMFATPTDEVARGATLTQGNWTGDRRRNPALRR